VIAGHSIPHKKWLFSLSVTRYAEVNPDYTQRPEPEAMLDAVRG